MDTKTQIFIERAEKVHGEKYDYTRTVYVQARSKLTISCKKHGDFDQIADSHLRGSGCIKCGVERRSNKQRSSSAIFVAKAIKVHGDKYDYSAVKYVRDSDKVTIICPKHGPWQQTPNNHLHNFGCSKCKSDRLRSVFADDLQSFTKKASNIHGRRFEYLGPYKNQNTPIEIQCPVHGAFKQKPVDHLKSSFGCPKCALETSVKATLLTHEEFVEKARAIHGKKYSYPEPYQTSLHRIGIDCPQHGVFKQSPNNHLHGHGCRFCQADGAAERVRLSHDEFVTKARKVHGDRFEYPEKYHASIQPIGIICPTHGHFKQTPNTHLAGAGCPRCMESLGERRISRLLESLLINFESQKKFHDCIDKRPLIFDFWLPYHTILIEFDGPQHFEPKHYFGGRAHFEATVRRDKIKTLYALEKGIRLIRIKYTEKEMEAILSLELSIVTEKQKDVEKGRG